MKSTISKYFRKGLFVALAGTMALSCSKMDEYKEKYVPNGEIVYTGKIDSVHMYPGKNRVGFTAFLNNDPRVTMFRVYWGAKADSATFTVKPGELGTAVYKTIPNVPEGEQSFEFVTFDASGNKSVSLYGSVAAFGTRFQESISNRAIKESKLNPQLETVVVLGGMDTATKAILTEIRYLTVNGDSASTRVPLLLPNTESEGVLPNHKYGSEVLYRTYFLPAKNAIDTFLTPYQSYQPISGAAWIDVSAQYVKNPGAPFNRASWDGARWGVLADWTTSADVKNASGGNGGWELRNNAGHLSMEGGWGLPAVPNGKIYQVVHLPFAGKWRFTSHMSDLGAAGTKYLVVNKAATLPDFADITSATYYLNFSTVSATATPYIEFRVDEPTNVCIGFVANMPNTGSYYKVRKVSLSFYKE
ncbi:DUF4998 domain-containing protein [Parasegetibacter sp. NRK P23]|uniref:DUF4998 domain-containing protein n=1 Tax=Parasegetibacter sp. NRK P23 TaxID=2942999 RepID=UPI0020443D84|nr:DUF4998 domain-containing protein [Parasegetibacter sp. NRK P23]MCM5528607.1 DUF5013 domain-containing protein [Parasegetibacter sp. NRK P23]